MLAVSQLPDEYEQIFSVNLQKNRKLAVLLNLSALAIAVIMFIPAAFAVPITALFDLSNGLLPYFIHIGILVLAIVLYLALHELIHGITMYCFGCKKVKYGFTGMYAYAGSDDYFDKKSYIIIALAPVVLFGVILSILCFLPIEWFWVVYFVQIINISGAVGDIYVTVKFAKMPKDILVADSGVEMTVYSKQNLQ